MLCVLMDSLSVGQARRVVNCPLDNMDVVLYQRSALANSNVDAQENAFLAYNFCKF